MRGMSQPPHRRSRRYHLMTTLVWLLLLILGIGCVSWEPIFRGSIHAVAIFKQMI